MPQRRVVLFDLDGTLVDSVHDITDSLNELLATHGFSGYPVRDVIGFIGKGAENLVQRAFAARGRELPRSELSVMTKALHEIYDPRMSLKTVAFPGVQEALEALQPQFTMAVVTNKRGDSATSLLKDLGLLKYFQVVLGGDYGGLRKPAPDSLFAALAAMGAQAEHAIMVGDSDNDILAAQAAQIRSVAVTFGYSERPVDQLGATWVIDRFAQLPSLVREALP